MPPIEVVDADDRQQKQSPAQDPIRRRIPADVGRLYRLAIEADAQLRPEDQQHREDPGRNEKQAHYSPDGRHKPANCEITPPADKRHSPNERCCTDTERENKRRQRHRFENPVGRRVDVVDRFHIHEYIPVAEYILSSDTGTQSRRFGIVSCELPPTDFDGLVSTVVLESRTSAVRGANFACSERTRRVVTLTVQPCPSQSPLPSPFRDVLH